MERKENTKFVVLLHFSNGTDVNITNEALEEFYFEQSIKKYVLANDEIKSILIIENVLITTKPDYNEQLSDFHTACDKGKITRIELYKYDENQNCISSETFGTEPGIHHTTFVEEGRIYYAVGPKTFSVLRDKIYNEKQYNKSVR